MFSGGSDGLLRVYDEKTGAVLKSIDAGTVISAPPMTYEIEGDQYVAVMAGLGGVMLGAQPPNFASSTYQSYERLLVFKLDGLKTPLPPLRSLPEKQAIPVGLPQDDETLAIGAYKYRRFCSTCHVARGFQKRVSGLVESFT